VGEGGFGLVEEYVQSKARQGGNASPDVKADKGLIDGKNTLEDEVEETGQPYLGSRTLRLIC